MTAHRSLLAGRSLGPVVGESRGRLDASMVRAGTGKRADPKRAGSAARRLVQAVLVGFERTAESFELAYRLGFSFGLELVRIVHEAIHQGIGESGIAEGGVP